MSAPRNREIGFVSSSFSFRACRACRACGRGEAAWAHADRYPYRWASRVRVSGCCVVSFRAPFRLVFVHRRMGFNTFCCFPCSFDRFLLAGAWVLRFVIAKTLYFTWVLRFVIAKTLYFTWVLRFVIAKTLYFTVVLKAWPHKPLSFTVVLQAWPHKLSYFIMVLKAWPHKPSYFTVVLKAWHHKA